MYLEYNRFTSDFYYKHGEKDGNAITSPTGAYSAQIYFQNYGGAAGGVNLFINVIFHLEYDIERTVYFSDAKSKAQLNWTGDDILSITNGYGESDRSIELVVGKEVYDEQGGACSTYKVKKNYTCFSIDSQ